MISEEKYNRLTRTTPFTEEEKAAFISRQLVETRQGTKVVTQILKQAFPGTEIVFVKAGEVSDFRKKYELLKVRIVNDYHHANDAYLNIVVGNTYLMKFTKDPLRFVRDAEKRSESYHMYQLFDWDVVRNGRIIWKADKKGETGTIATVRKVMARNTPLMTKMCVEKHGGITGKQTIWDKETAKGSGYIPVKMSDSRLQDVTRYGGFTSVSTSGYCLVEYTVKGKRIRSLEALPIYLGRSAEIEAAVLLEYITQTLTAEYKGKAVTDIRICRKLIPRGSLIKYDGFYYYLAGKTKNDIEVDNAVELCLGDKHMKYLKKVEKAEQQSYYDEKDENGNLIITLERNLELYSILVEKYKKTIWSCQRGTLGKIIIGGLKIFEKLDVKKQCYTLLQIISHMNNQIVTADMEPLEATSKAGKLLIGKRISNADEVILISQSITGLYQAEIDLLTV